MSQCLNPNCLYKNPDRSNFCQRCGTPLKLRSHFRAISMLGQGGFGRTFLAVDEDKPKNQTCVIKQLYPQAQGTDNLEKAAKLFQQEAEQLDELEDHPQIPKLLAYFTEGGYQYLVQEYIDGQDLDKILETQGKFSEKQIRDILQQILPILQHLHERNIIHRDIKPENIIRRRDGKLILVDFGAAKQIANAASSVTGTIIGSVGYVSLEQVKGKARPNSDIYSLGATCVRLLTQIEPTRLFEAITEGKWRNQLKASIDWELDRILDKMLAVLYQERYQSAGEVLRDLQPAKAASSSPPSKPKSPSTTKSSQKQPPPKPKSPSPSPSTATSGSQVELRSAVGYDYTKLRDLLANQKWKEADEETAKAMLKIAGRDDFLREKDIDNFPCEDLRTIDRLWLKFSNGKFGFSVQKEIYQKLGGTRKFDREIWRKFGDTVGWRVDDRWKNLRELNWRRPLWFWTPEGQLPSLLWVSVESWCGFGWRGRESLLSRRDL